MSLGNDHDVKMLSSLLGSQIESLSISIVAAILATSDKDPKHIQERYNQIRNNVLNDIRAKKHG